MTCPPGGLPFHPKEFGVESSHNIITRTGLVGIGVLLLCAFWSLFVLVITSPFLLLGLMEVVAAQPNNYRVRWIRREPS